MTQEQHPVLRHSRPLSFAHRGNSAGWPENTLPAFRSAVDLGCDFIETDLWLTRDGVLVTFHDPDLGRTTNGEGPLKARTLAELQELDAGHHFAAEQGYPLRGRQITIPTFEQVIQLSPNMRFNVELKDGTQAACGALLELIARHQLENRIIVAAHRHATIKNFRRQATASIATGASQREIIYFLLASRLGCARWLPVHYQALQVPVRHRGIPLLTETFLAHAHARKLAVHAWTINDAAEMKRLRALGVDGIMSDRPDVLVALLRSGEIEPGVLVR